MRWSWDEVNSKWRRVSVKVGDAVIVKPGVQDPDFGTNLTGWQGKVCEVSDDQTLVCIDWDGPTLQNMPDSMIAQCEEEGMEWSQMYLEVSEVELATPRDMPENGVAQIKKQIQAKHAWDHLGEEGKRIQQILAQVDPEDELAMFAAWKAHFQKVLRFPFAAEVSEFQERGRLQEGDAVMIRGIADIDDLMGVLVQVEHERGVFAFPLCDLEVTDTGSSNYEPVRIYAVWFANR